MDRSSALQVVGLTHRFAFRIEGESTKRCKDWQSESSLSPSPARVEKAASELSSHFDTLLRGHKIQRCDIRLPNALLTGFSDPPEIKTVHDILTRTLE
jgi:hypothetical protein